jgi:putative tryptophan/tyrosine transport system substrate-binding protein
MQRREFITLVGGAAARPLTALAEKAFVVHHIAVVHPALPVSELNENTQDSDLWSAFFKEIRRLGYVEGQNLSIERRSAEGKPERNAEIARDLISLKPEVIFVGTGRLALTFKDQNTPVPVVMTVGVDPVSMGIVDSLSRPTGNITGFCGVGGPEFYGKYVQLLREVRPDLKKVGFVAPKSAWGATYQKIAASLSASTGISIIGPGVESPSGEAEHRLCLTTMISEGVEGLIISESTEHIKHRRFIVDFAREHQLPAIYAISLFARDGGLMSYAVDYKEMGKGAAHYVDLIIQGAKPSELPIQQPTKFELIVNLKAARAAAIDISASVLASADEVIE